MSLETLRYATIMLLAGVGVPILAAMNAQLGQRIGSPAAASLLALFVAFVATAAVLAATGGFQALANLSDAPRHLWFAGLLMAFYILSVTWIAPHFGVGNAIMCVLLGQLLAAGTIDHFGLFGAMVRPINLMRAAGLSFMAVGVILAQRA